MSSCIMWFVSVSVLNVHVRVSAWNPAVITQSTLFWLTTFCYQFYIGVIILMFLFSWSFLLIFYCEVLLQNKWFPSWCLIMTTECGDLKIRAHKIVFSGAAVELHFFLVVLTHSFINLMINLHRVLFIWRPFNPVTLWKCEPLRLVLLVQRQQSFHS